ncbi:MAG: hypothetical protein JWO42_361 [Chloroflexi bacterium]|nr:hypothetical protein [Chloroflexota bacterium]
MGAHTRRTTLKYMLLMNSGPIEGVPSTYQWTPEEVKAGWAHMGQLYQELTESGELVGTEMLAGPQAAKFVTSDGVSAPVVTDGPFPESKELLAGYWMVDVESEERAIEIAARTSAAPGPGGRPTRRPIELRPIMSAHDPVL